MREILFRGKRKCDGRWVEGYYIQQENPFTEDGMPIKHLIFEVAPFAEEVDPDTVGQYTGLTDMNGKKIFEGDILECWPGLSDHCRGYVKYGEWNCSCCHGVYGWMLNKDGDLRDPDTSEVIGNIWDNKELLGGLTQEGPDR